MNVGKALYSIINSSVSIYPKVAPQGASGTYAVYHVISTTPTDVKERTSVSDVYRVQISIYADTYSDLMTASDTIRGLIDKYKGTVATVPIQLIRFENQIDGFDIDSDKYSLIHDYMIHINKIT